MSHQYELIRCDTIRIDEEFNCRGKVDTTDEEFRTLALDISRRGVDTPIIVEPIESPHHQFRVIAGHRRLTASIYVNKELIPAIVRRNLTQEERELINFQENLVRKNLSFLQETDIVARLKRRGKTDQAIGDMFSMSRSWATLRSCFARFPREYQEKLSDVGIGGPDVKRLYGIYVSCPTLPNSGIPDIRRFVDEAERFISSKADRKGRAFNPKSLDEQPGPGQHRTRTRVEFQALMQRLADNTLFGEPDITMTLLQWAVGVTTDVELDEALSDYFAEQGKPFNY